MFTLTLRVTSLQFTSVRSAQSAAAAAGRMGKKKGGDAGGGAPPLPEEVAAAIAYLSKYVDPASPLHADADEQAKAEKAAETLATFSSEARPLSPLC